MRKPGKRLGGGGARAVDMSGIAVAVAGLDCGVGCRVEPADLLAGSGDERARDDHLSGQVRGMADGCCHTDNAMAPNQCVSKTRFSAD